MKSIPRLVASSFASSSDSSDEYRDGMATPSTFSAPTASAATTAVSEESILADSPTTHDAKPFFRQ